MAKCDLSIELDEPDRIYTGGDKVRGTVRVVVDDNVRCKGLEITSGWYTHGRGNVAKGTAETQTLFEGEWMAGDEESYRFELDVAAWPPSYHGNYINVDHHVEVRAKIPWAFDPKASQPFVMRPQTPPDPASSENVTSVGGCVGAGIVAVVLLAFGGGMIAILAGLAANPLAGLVVAAIVFPLLGFAAGKFLLPRWLLGNVESELLTTEVAPGGSVRARMTFQPRRNVTLNAITAELSGSEVCVSGSGSNRTTHRNPFYTDQHTLLESSTLAGGQRKEFELEFPVPDDVPYSFDLNDNDLKWTVELRVDIPRWPDWSKSLKLNVYPDPNVDSREPQAADAATTPPESASDAEAAGSPGGEITFAETAAHLWQARHDDQQRAMLVDAVRGLTFDIEARIERRLLYSGSEDPNVYPDGHAVWARYGDPPLPLVLYIPERLADEFEQAGHRAWPLRGTILGWDDQHERLQLKVLVD
jgi:hypothetical protein